jgi:hypothetical protein
VDIAALALGKRAAAVLRSPATPLLAVRSIEQEILDGRKTNKESIVKITVKSRQTVHGRPWVINLLQPHVFCMRAISGNSDFIFGDKLYSPKSLGDKN